MTVTIYSLPTDEATLYLCSDKTIERLKRSNEDAQKLLLAEYEAVLKKHEWEKLTYEVKPYKFGDNLEAQRFERNGSGHYQSVLMAKSLGLSVEEVEAMDAPLAALLWNEIEFVSVPNPFGTAVQSKPPDKNS